MKQRFSVMKMNLTYRAGARDPLGLKNQICRIIMLIWIQKFSHFSMVFGSSRPVGSCCHYFYIRWKEYIIRTGRDIFVSLLIPEPLFLSWLLILIGVISTSCSSIGRESSNYLYFCGQTYYF